MFRAPRTDYETWVQMDGPRCQLHVGQVPYGGQKAVEQHIVGDIMRSVAHLYPKLLGDIKVLLYSGQLDVIVGAPLTEAMINNFPDSPAFDAAGWATVGRRATRLRGTCSMT